MIGRNRTAPSAGHLFGWYTLQRPLRSQVYLVWPPLHLFWPPPVRLFAQPTHVREASPQHPAGDVDAYAHTHAHADQLWGPGYENTKNPPSPFWRMLKTLSVYIRTPEYVRSHKTASSTPNLETALQYITKYSIARILQQHVSYVRV